MAGTGTAHLRPDGEALLRVDELVVDYPTAHGVVHAVSGISFDALPGETVGLVGESGCGKSTTGRAIVGLTKATGGSIHFDGHDLLALTGEARRRVRPGLQMIFQDPVSSLNPRRTVRQIVGEGLAIWGVRGDRAKRIDAMLEFVGFDPDAVSDRRPSEFSGGQCQRVSIARSLIMDPKLIICDEPVSALDVSVQAQIINLLEDLRRERGLTLLFIAHDLAVVKSISDRVIVMYLGKICEVASADELYASPYHPYTVALLASIPGEVVDPAVDHAVRGEPPSPVAPPSGCRFRMHCPRADDRCASEEPVLRSVSPTHFVACHHAAGPAATALTATTTTTTTATTIQPIQHSQGEQSS